MLMILLTILDGWGVREADEGNALSRAEIPNYKSLLTEFPSTLLVASGEAVGLPRGQMGNSEVGHLNMGAGRVVYQELTRISRAIETGDFRRNQPLNQALDRALSGGGTVHLMGLFSDGGVHSDLSHLLALLELCARRNLKDVYLHLFLDGRDVPPQSALNYFAQLRKELDRLGLGQVATVMGRYYAMDRDRRWERTEKAYRAMVLGEGLRAASPEEAVQQSYQKGVTDEFVEPVVVTGDDGEPVARIKDDDTVIFFNFRADRARQITRAFVDQDFKGFARPKFPRVHFVCLTLYDQTIPAPVAFEPQELKDTLGEVLARQGKRQLRIAETEKYAHVTFFFNGGIETRFPGEDRILIPSPKVATYDLKPEMSAGEVTGKVLEQITSAGYDLIILNYANPDMVGHTGDMAAAVKAVETVDHCLGRLSRTVLDRGDTLLVTADHGNVELMQDEGGKPHTAHTTSPVPFILVNEALKDRHLRRGSLEDVAPTILELMGLPRPEAMTGESLII